MKFDLELNKIHLADVVDFINKISDQSVDMVFADPEYNIKARGGRFSENVKPWAVYWAWCENWVLAAQRIIKPTGSIFIKCPARTSGNFQVALDDCGFDYRNQIILYCPCHPTKRSFLTTHEVLLFYAKDMDKSYFHYQAEMKPRDPDKNWWYKENYRSDYGDRINDLWMEIKWLPAGSLFAEETILEPGTRLKAHPNQMAEKIAERAIMFTTRPGDLVVDFFSGSGTVSAAAKKLGRNFLACDIDPHYVELGNQRISQQIIKFDQNDLLAMEKASTEPRSAEIQEGLIL